MQHSDAVVRQYLKEHNIKSRLEDALNTVLMMHNLPDDPIPPFLAALQHGRTPLERWLTPSTALQRKLTLHELAQAGLLVDKRVFLRLDLNVGLKDKGKPPFGLIKDDTRIQVSLPSIRDCLNAGARSVVLCSHLDRPTGRTPALSLRTVAVRLSELLGRQVTFLEDCVGPEAEAACAAASGGSVILLENVRFHAEEEGKGCEPHAIAAFRASLARLGDIYVNDAFATMHRGHSSMLGDGFAVRAMGPLVERELGAFEKLLDAPAHPVVAIAGGYKLDKIGELSPLCRHVDSLLAGGGIGSAFVRASRGVEIGGEAYDAAAEAASTAVLDEAAARNVKVLLPQDWSVSYLSPFTKPGEAEREGRPVVYGDVARLVRTSEGVPTERVRVTYRAKDGGVTEVDRPWKPFDIGPATIASFVEEVRSARTIFWNGPPGIYNMPATEAGSRAVVDAVMHAVGHGAQVLLGGGGTSELFRKLCSDEAGVSKLHVCTGGGVSLELLAGKTLPGLASLTDKSDLNTV